MSAFLSKKLSLVLLLCACGVAVAIVFLLHYALAGPRLGPVYDILLGFRASPPVSGEIVRIETDEVIEPGDVFSVLMTLSEMGAAGLLVEVPVLGTGSGMADGGAEMSYRINDEFNLLGRNIRTLFEAIRMGLVPPAESPTYVENLVELTERGRDRLNAAIIRQDEAGSERAAQAAAVFGKAITAADLRVVPWDMPLGEIPWYSRPQPDKDRVIRRAAPVITGENAPASSDPSSEHLEHIVYHALKPRWEQSSFEYTEAGPVLINRFMVQGEETEYRFPLDRDGNILFDKPGNNAFRRLTLNHFRDYEQTGRHLARLLKEAQAMGAYSQTMPERVPLILYDYAEKLKEELLKKPEQGKYAAWLKARADYIASLEEFLYGPAEMTLVNGYEKLISGERHGEAGLAKLQGMRDELIRVFVAMREKHRELIELRTILTAEIDSSFCIMGAAPPAAGSDTPESSALLANALLTGFCITPGQYRHSIFWSLAAAFFVLLSIHALRPAALFLTGFTASLLCAAAFGLQFVLNAYWIDPFIPTAACLGATLFLTVCRFGISYGRALRFRMAYAPTVNKEMLKRLLKVGRPPLAETLCTDAAIIAIKDPSLSGREDRKKPAEAVKAAAAFRKNCSRIFKREGALLLGFEHDIALACFGSPPERVCQGKQEMAHPAKRAVICITNLLNRKPPRKEDAPATKWQFGIESGSCAFSWSAETGYTANGRPVVRARIFAALAKRYNVQAIIGESAKESINLPAPKLSSLSGESFYKLPMLDF